MAESKCTQGDDCMICHRKDGSEGSSDNLDMRIVTYVGDKVVITADHRTLTDPFSVLMTVLTGKEESDFDYETAIIGVGEGSLRSALDLPSAQEFYRHEYSVSDVPDTVQGVHDMIVEQLKNGEIDLSNPIEF